jgi:hypothetical protein
MLDLSYSRFSGKYKLKIKLLKLFQVLLFFIKETKSIRDIIVKTKNTVPLTHRRAESVAIKEPVSTDLVGLKNLKNNLLSKNRLRPSLEE